MDAKEYLNQAIYINQKIDMDLREAERLKELSTRISAVQYDKEFVSTCRSTNAPFKSILDRLWKIEKETANDVERLTVLKDQIDQVINDLDDEEEKLVLRYRYFYHMSWKDIGDVLHVDRTTIYRWHEKALGHLNVPDENA